MSKSKRTTLAVQGASVAVLSENRQDFISETCTLKPAVRRNPDRFPEDLMFELTAGEVSNLRSQTVISSSHGGSRHGNLAFTEQGVAMLSSVLRSTRAVEVNIAIMRAFVRLCEMRAATFSRTAESSACVSRLQRNRGAHPGWPIGNSIRPRAPVFQSKRIAPRAELPSPAGGSRTCRTPAAFRF